MTQGKQASREIGPAHKPNGHAHHQRIGAREQLAAHRRVCAERDDQPRQSGRQKPQEGATERQAPAFSLVQLKDAHDGKDGSHDRDRHGRAGSPTAAWHHAISMFRTRLRKAQHACCQQRIED